jgi:hypothetical protein
LLRTWHSELPPCLTAFCRSARLSYPPHQRPARSSQLSVK